MYLGGRKKALVSPLHLPRATYFNLIMGTKFQSAESQQENFHAHINLIYSQEKKTNFSLNPKEKTKGIIQTHTATAIHQSQNANILLSKRCSVMLCATKVAVPNTAQQAVLLPQLKVRTRATELPPSPRLAEQHECGEEADKQAQRDERMVADEAVNR